MTFDERQKRNPTVCRVGKEFSNKHGSYDVYWISNKSFDMNHCDLGFHPTKRYRPNYQFLN